MGRKVIIDVEAVKKEVAEYRYEFPHYAEQKNTNEMIDIFINIIDSYADEGEEIQTGKWIFKEFDEATGIKQRYWCSVCNKAQAQMGLNYCAYCGAEMENTDI